MYTAKGRKNFSPSSNTNSGDESADNIIRKYARPRRNNKLTLNTNNRPLNLLGNYYYALSDDGKRNKSCHKKIALDNHLYEFITNYCREEIKREVDSKLIENTAQPQRSSYDSNNGEDQPNTSEQLKEFTDKETNCQSFVNLYDQEFVHRTIERNARLRRLIRKLVTAHQKQMHNEAWNNFINDLKNKHDPDRMPRTKNNVPIQDQENLLEFIDDCYNTKFSCAHSNICENLLEDIYKVPYLSRFCSNYRTLNKDRYNQENNSFPTASLARLATLHKQIELQERSNCVGIRTYSNNFNPQDQYPPRKDNTLGGAMPSYAYTTYSSSLRKSFRESIAQTDLEKLSIDVTTKANFVQDLYKNTNLGEVSKNSQPQQEDVKEFTLKHIESKLEIIIDSINNFMKELKPKKKLKTSRRTTNIHVVCKECNHVKRDLLKKINDNVLFDSDKYNSSNSILHVNPVNTNSDITKLNEIFSKELGESIYDRNRTCAVQFDFEEPTKERSTEVTKSLSATWTKISNDAEEILLSGIQHNQQITIAVNTDPLSFLALLKISTEAMKSLLAYVPNFDYYYYLSRLQFPQLTRCIEHNLICNFCGANFSNPSELNDHILDHNLGESRNCSVCRHVLKTLGRRSKLYGCRYCGECFTRAYCCELHQDTCPKRQGQSHEADPDLLILR